MEEVGDKGICWGYRGIMERKKEHGNCSIIVGYSRVYRKRPPQEAPPLRRRLGGFHGAAARSLAMPVAGGTRICPRRPEPT